jgi:hypothetical protein
MQDFDISKGFPMLGFAVQDLASSQIAYTLTYNCNEWLHKEFRINIALFYQAQWLTPIQPEFAQYHMANSVAFTGSLVATTADTAFSIRPATRAKRFFYIYDLEILRNNSNREYWDIVMNDDTITKFTRSKSYLDYLKDLGYQIDERIVPSFEIEKILEITHGYDSSRIERSPAK